MNNLENLQILVSKDIISEYNLKNEDIEMLARVAKFQEKDMYILHNHRSQIEDVDFEGISLEGDVPLDFHKYEYPHGIARFYDEFSNSTICYGILNRQFDHWHLTNKEIGRVLTDTPIKIIEHGKSKV